MKQWQLKKRRDPISDICEEIPNNQCDLSKMFHNDSQNECHKGSNQIQYRNLILKSLLAFLLGIAYADLGAVLYAHIYDKDGRTEDGK